MTAKTQTPKATTRKPGQRRTTAEKISDGKARRDAQQAKAKAERTCAAGRQRKDGSWAYGIELKRRCQNPPRRPNAGLCLDHDNQFRRAKAKAAPKTAAKKSNVVSIDSLRDQLPAGVLAPADDVPAEALAAFSTPELAAKAVAKRRAAKAPAKS